MRKKDETKQAKILNAAADIILKQGAAAISTVKVAKAVGISQSNVYLYFKNKDALLISVYRREMSKIDAAGGLDRLLDRTISVTDRLNLYLESIYDYAVANPDSLTLIQQVKFLFGQYDSNPFSETFQNGNNPVVTLIEEAISAGVLKQVPVSVVMSLVFSVIHTHTLNMQRGLYDEVAFGFDTFAQLVMTGIKK